MLEKMFTVPATDQKLPAVELGNGAWLFHAHLTTSFAKVARKEHSARWLADNVPKKWRLEIKLPGKKGRPATYLTEAGFYFVVSQAQTPVGWAFRDWVFEDVLPGIRKEGGYISSDATASQLMSLQSRIAQLHTALVESETQREAEAQAMGEFLLRSNQDVAFVEETLAFDF